MENLISGHFSPHSPLGRCPACHGLGTRLAVDPARIVQAPERSILDGALRWYGDLRKHRSTWWRDQVQSIASHYGADLEQPWQDLPAAFRAALLYGSGEEQIRFTHQHDADAAGWSGTSARPAKGIVYSIHRAFRETESESARRWYGSFMSRQPCPTCGGTRLGRAAAA